MPCTWQISSKRRWQPPTSPERPQRPLTKAQPPGIEFEEDQRHMENALFVPPPSLPPQEERMLLWQPQEQKCTHPQSPKPTQPPSSLFTSAKLYAQGAVDSLEQGQAKESKRGA